MGLPSHAQVAEEAVAILAKIQADKDYDRLKESSQQYSDCWATFTGFPIICKYDIDADKGPLFEEALRALCLKAAVYDLTDGDEQAAELLMSLPVDEMTHAILAQHNLVTAIQHRHNILLPHMTDKEHPGYEPGDYTDTCYTLAWGEPDRRYWIGWTETKRRLGILNLQYDKAGFTKDGRSHAFDFEPAPA